MRSVVTGGAGFVGSSLVEHLVDAGHDVVLVDALRDYAGTARKQRAIDELVTRPGVEHHDADLVDASLRPLLDGADAVFHLAAQPGVRASWSDGFGEYATDNVVATQRLLEAMADTGGARLVYASSSSVYGNALTHPTPESILPAPVSPYGVTKLAAEHLCGAYARDRGVHAVSLRYFTVYGPRQRPDMALHRLFESSLGGSPFPRFGDGGQVRDVTYVGDVVRATAAAATAEVAPGTVLNIAGGTQVTLAGLIERVGALTGREVPIDPRAGADGDVRRTSGAVEAAARILGWHPEVDLDEGLKRQLAWHLEHRDDQP